MPRKVTGWLPLFDGSDLSKWWFEDPEHVRVQDGTLVFDERAVRAEVGGMSWENYELSAEVMIRITGEDAFYQVELTASGSCTYCQLLPGWMVLAYFSSEKNATDHFGKATVDVRPGQWHEFVMRAEEGLITVVFDGKELVRGTSPNGTRGMPGIIVKKVAAAEPRLRNLRIRFLSPTPEQIREYDLDAATNWQNYEAGRRDGSA